MHALRRLIPLLPLLLILVGTPGVAQADGAAARPTSLGITLDYSPWITNTPVDRATTFRVTGGVSSTPPPTTTWSFGDGTPTVVGAPNETGDAVHSFATLGTWLVSATQTDGAGNVVARGSQYVSSFDSSVGAGISLIYAGNQSVLSIVQHQNAAGMYCNASYGRSLCRIVARVEPDLQRRLGLLTDVVGRGAPSEVPGDTLVWVRFTREAVAALAALREDVTIRYEATVTLPLPDGRTGTRIQNRQYSGMATSNDCPLVAGPVSCRPGAGENASEVVPGEAGFAGEPAVTGLRLAVRSAADTGQRVEATYLNDVVLGLYGSDVLLGKDGDDVIKGDASPSARPGDLQRDVLDGAFGDDWISAGGGTNTISGGAGDDRIFAVQGRGLIHCGNGTDTVTLKKQTRLKRTRRQIRAHRKPKLTPDTYSVTACETIIRR